MHTCVLIYILNDLIDLFLGGEGKINEKVPLTLFPKYNITKYDVFNRGIELLSKWKLFHHGS